MASKQVETMKKTIAEAVEKFNSSHDKKLEYVGVEPPSGVIVYAAKYKFGEKFVYLMGCKDRPFYGCTGKDDLDYMDEFLETLK